MTTKRAVLISAGASGVGLFFALVLSGDRVISVPAWLAATAVALIAVLLRDLVAAAGVAPARMMPIWSRPERRRLPSDPRGVRTIAALLGNAQHNPRVFTKHLRPTLVAMAEHYLPIRQGVELGGDQARTNELLGEVAWLLDPAVVDRAPHLAELEQFVDVIVGEENPEGEVAP